MSALGDLLSSGVIESAETNHSISTQWLTDAERHLTAAHTIADIDPSGAIMLAYEAARMSVAAVLLDTGHRVRNRAGSHQVLSHFAEDLAAQTAEPALTRLDELRSYRSHFDFRPDGEGFLVNSTDTGSGGIHEAIATAAKIRTACATAIHSRQTSEHRKEQVE